jgi:hypothetical protein
VSRGFLILKSSRQDLKNQGIRDQKTGVRKIFNPQFLTLRIPGFEDFWRKKSGVGGM